MSLGGYSWTPSLNCPNFLAYCIRFSKHCILSRSSIILYHYSWISLIIISKNDFQIGFIVASYLNLEKTGCISKLKVFFILSMIVLSRSVLYWFWCSLAKTRYFYDFSFSFIWIFLSFTVTLIIERWFLE